MAYAAISFSALEQPTLAKWNILGTNDAYFNTQIGANFSSGTTSTVWWEELGRTTLGGTATSISVASLAARKYLKILYLLIPSGSLNTGIRFNNDSGANYSWRIESDNTGAAATAATNGAITGTGAYNSFGTLDVVNLASIAKTAVGNTSMYTDVASAAPSSQISWSKWANTSSQITRFDIFTSSNNFAAGSQVVVLGHD